VVLALYNDRPPSEAHVAAIHKDSLLERVEALNSRANRKGLDSLDPARNRLIRIGMEIGDSGRVIQNGLGVFDLSRQSRRHPEWPRQIEDELREIHGRIKQAHGTKLRFSIWAGVGGLAEDKKMYNAAGLLKRGPRCYVLDSTDPARLDDIFDDMSRRSGLAMPALLKSALVAGLAAEMSAHEAVLNLERLAVLYARHKVDARPNFVVMAPPGSLLDRLASSRGYRKVDLQPDRRHNTQGRHSSPLTRGSLYALGLSGADMGAWMQAAALEDDEIDIAWRLAAFLHAQGLAGRDKVTLMLPREWPGAALWTKQVFEGSLGKSERFGIKIVVEEKIRLPNYRPPKDPAQDRLFLAVQRKGSPGTDARKVALLRHAGYPVATLALPARSELSRWMQFVHYAVLGIAYLRDMNFITQPNIECWRATGRQLRASAEKLGDIEKTKEWQQMRSSTRQAKWRGRVTLFVDHAAAPELPSAPEIYASLLGRLSANHEIDYAALTFFGDLRSSAGGRALRTRLHRGAEALFRSRLKMPVDVEEGRVVGQSYHEMIAGHGKCFSTLLFAAGAGHDRAQFLATAMALAERRRAVVAIALRDLEEATLAALEEFFRQAAKHL
jgi:hypothetical protein